jgi:hypothetical protein
VNIEQPSRLNISIGFVNLNGFWVTYLAFLVLKLVPPGAVLCRPVNYLRHMTLFSRPSQPPAKHVVPAQCGTFRAREQPLTKSPQARAHRSAPVRYPAFAGLASSAALGWTRNGKTPVRGEYQG